MLKLGTQDIKALYLGERKVKRACLGERVVFAEAKPSRLPAGYTEVEYIQGAGGTNGPYINTGLTAKSTTKLTMDVETTSVSTNTGTTGVSSTTTAFFGSYRGYKSTSSYNYRYMFYIYCTSKGIYGYAGRYSLNTTVTPSPIGQLITSTVTPRRMVLTADMATRELSVDSTTVVSSNTTSSAVGTSKIYLLKASVTNSTSALSSAYFRASLEAKLYSCQIYTGDSLVADYVPCIDPNGDVGLYDLVNDKFYKSAATEQFTAGPAI